MSWSIHLFLLHKLFFFADSGIELLRQTRLAEFICLNMKDLGGHSMQKDYGTILYLTCKYIRNYKFATY